MPKGLLCICIVMLMGFLCGATSAARSIGVVKSDGSELNNHELDIKIYRWKGRKFIFLEKHPLLQKNGFLFSVKRNMFSGCKPGKYETDVCYLKYKQFVGKVITCKGFTKCNIIKCIAFEVDGMGMTIYSNPQKDHVEGIALLDDLEKAKERWLGKKIYSKRGSISTYDEKSGKFGKISVDKNESLKVIDVWWGIRTLRPIWLIVERNNGEKGYISIAFSWTNIYFDRWKDSRPWVDEIFEVDPNRKYKWNKDVWRIINNNKVKLGMSKEQVTLSWGKPEKVNRDINTGVVCEQWVYEKNYLYFQNGKLVMIQPM